MSTAQPFPVLASADNSRSASPANSPPPKPAAQRGKSGGRGGGKARGKKSQGSANNSSGEAAPVKRVNWSGKQQQQQRSVVAVAGPSSSPSSSSTTTESGLLATADNRLQRKKAAPTTETVAAPKRQQPKPARGGRRTTAEPVPAETAPPPLQQQQQPIHGSHAGRTGSLPMAMIVAGENGRARVLFNPPPQQNYVDDVAADSPPPQFIGQPRFPVSSSQQRRSSMSHYNSSSNGGGSRMRYSSGEGLGLASPGVGHSIYSAPATARCVTTPPEFRQRSMTSTQLRVSAPVFTPQQQQHHYQAPVTPVSPAMSREPPMSAPAYDGRGRSQSVSTHVSLTGLRISMAQSRPGNVLAPHLPVLSRASSGGVVGVQTNAYANGGYFATRRASVSNVGLAADLSHSIRIPAVLFQKHAERRSHDAAEPGTADAETQDASASGESPAMKRLQEMISSMRALGSAPPTPKPAEAPNSAAPAAATVEDEEGGLAPVSLVDDASLEESSVVQQQQQAPTAHPTSRFDSILEEDEDADEDEANLDADDGSVTVTDASDRAATAPKTSALFVV
ncbi:hypothetical protein IWW37_003540 [Coemansia sp. RSA 2050]|nr:hypothetical protein IWW37_003540 [Coemansia sp. RSA 2050]KAJ2732950.1 hypothetical protein IW152_003444 [Coemansia sp. BCRC 34962]